MRLPEVFCIRIVFIFNLLRPCNNDYRRIRAPKITIVNKKADTFYEKDRRRVFNGFHLNYGRRRILSFKNCLTRTYTARNIKRSTF